MLDTTNSPFRRLAGLVRRMRSTVSLRRPLGRMQDATIDRHLKELGWTRDDLFRPELNPGTHRRRISRMMASLKVPVDLAVSRNWKNLKLADHRCAYCHDVRRCEQWLQIGLGADGPPRFCPNGTFFTYLKTLAALEDNKSAATAD